MGAAAARDGIMLDLVSAFRTVEYQRGIGERKLAAGFPVDDILRVSAAPDYSEHHPGCAVLTAHDIPVLRQGGEAGIFGLGFAGATTTGITLLVPTGQLDEAMTALRPPP